MTTADERKRILKMLEEGKISIEESIQLLDALKAGARGEAAGATTDKRWFRLRVTDARSGTTKLNVNVPLGLVWVGARMGARFVPNLEGVDVENIMVRIREGEAGQLLDVVDGNERFEIYVE
jgi:hypothetical protein